MRVLGYNDPVPNKHISNIMKLFVLAVCLAVVTGDHDTSTESDGFCNIVNIFLNPVFQTCQRLRQDDPDAFCSSNCSQQVAQALYDCGDSNYSEIISLCAQDPVSMQFCGAVNRNETMLANLNVSCSESENCSEECQAAVDNIGCCVNYIRGDFSVAQCNVKACTTIEVNSSLANALICYRSHLHDNPTLDGCHDQLIASTVSQNEAITTSFCDGNCPTAVADLYSECGLSTFASIVKNGCEKDERGRYCGNVLPSSINPEWEILVDRAVLACDGADCSSGVCETAINNIGCCLALDVQVNVTISALLPVAQCDVKHCSPSSSASTIYAFPLLMILEMVAVMILQN